MTVLTADQHAALVTLAEALGDDSCVVIGATGLAFHLEMRWRRTHDIDLAVAVGVDTAQSVASRLAGWTRHPQKEHEWLAPGDVKIDLLPDGPELTAAGSVTWPETGARMSLVGMRLAFGLGRPHASLPRGMRVAPAEVIALLKMVAYVERPAERVRDLGDVAHVLESLLARDEDERFRVEPDLDDDTVCSFVLGERLRHRLDPEEFRIVRRFIAMARDESDRHATQAKLLRDGPAWMRESPGELLRRLDALERGLTGQLGMHG